MIIDKELPPISKDPVLHVMQGEQPKVMVGMARTEEPPPYVNEPAQLPTRPVFPPQPVPASTSSLAQYGSRSVSSSNHLYVKTRHEPIDGVFHIDPELDSVALGKGSRTALDTRSYNQKHRQKHRHHGRKGFWKRVEVSEPNAIFQTRHGPMSLDLHIVAGARPRHTPALVQVATRHGSLDINLHSINQSRRLNMEVSTHHGHVHILIPRSFSGYIQLYSKHGDRIFLPSLANSMQLVYRREKETQVVVGGAVNALPAKGTDWVGDTIHVATRHGKVLVGYLGEDTFPVPEPGFWKKLGDTLQEKLSESLQRKLTDHVQKKLNNFIES